MQTWLLARDLSAGRSLVVGVKKSRLKRPESTLGLPRCFLVL